ncbi:MAG: hypothetical protein ACK4P1_09565, partial [Aggregatilineales bacterium]
MPVERLDAAQHRFAPDGVEACPVLGQSPSRNLDLRQQLREALVITVEKQVFLVAAHFQRGLAEIGDCLTGLDLTIEVVEIDEDDDREAQHDKLREPVGAQDFVAKTGHGRPGKPGCCSL